MLVAASYFWSDALNAFLFANVILLTGLNINSANVPFDLLNKPDHRLDIKKITDSYIGYINHHKKDVTVQHREHAALLNYLVGVLHILWFNLWPQGKLSWNG